MTEEEEKLKKRERASVAEANMIHKEIKKEVITDFLNYYVYNTEEGDLYLALEEYLK